MRKPKRTLMEAIGVGGGQGLDNVVRDGVFGRRKRMTKAEKRKKAIDALMLRAMADDEVQAFWKREKAQFFKGRNDLAKANEEFAALATEAMTIAATQIFDEMGDALSF